MSSNRDIAIDFAKLTWSIIASRSSRAWVASSRARSRSFRKRSTSNCNSFSVDITIPIWSPLAPTPRPRISGVSQLPERVRTTYPPNGTILCSGIPASVMAFCYRGKGQVVFRCLATLPCLSTPGLEYGSLHRNGRSKASSIYE